MTISLAFKEKVLKLIESQAPSLVDLYRHLHAHPELSGQEAQTARRVAEELSAAGCCVTGGSCRRARLWRGPGRPTQGGVSLPCCAIVVGSRCRARSPFS